MVVMRGDEGTDALRRLGEIPGAWPVPLPLGVAALQSSAPGKSGSARRGWLWAREEEEEKEEERDCETPTPLPPGRLLVRRSAAGVVRLPP